MSGEFGWYRPWLTSLQDAQALSSKAKAVAAILATRENAQREGDGILHRRAKNLAVLASLNEKTVRLALAELVAGGWIQVRRSRDHLAITLVRRSGVTPDLTPPLIGSDARSRSGVTPALVGSDARSRSGVTPDIPTGAARATAPQPPEGERRAPVIEGDVAPLRPTSRRKRDLDEFEAQMAAWAAVHFPAAADPRGVASVVSWARSRGAGGTPGEIERFARAAGETWSSLLGLNGESRRREAA